MKGVSSSAEAWMATSDDMGWAASLPVEIEVLVIALGCTLTRNNLDLSTSSKSSLHQGIAQAKKHKGVLVCVGSGYHQKMKHTECSLMMEKAKTENPALPVFGEPNSYNTPMNAICMAAALRSRRVKKIILTCDPIHAMRAQETFRTIFSIYGVRCPEIVPGVAVIYGNSSKWFLRSHPTWLVWNLLGRALLPLQVQKIRKEFKKRYGE